MSKEEKVNLNDKTKKIIVFTEKVKYEFIISKFEIISDCYCLFLWDKEKDRMDIIASFPTSGVLGVFQNPDYK